MNVYQRISEVMKEVERLQKDDVVGKGTKAAYKAISEEKVTTAVRNALIKHGLVILPIKQTLDRTDTSVVDQYGNNKIQRLSSVDVVYRIMNIEEPDDFIDVVSSGTGVDTQDKGVGKAMTYSYKYMLLRTFAIPTGEDPDKVSSQEIDEELKQAPTPPPVKRKPELTPAHEKWGAIVKHLAMDNPIEDVEKKYRFSAEVREQLLDEAMNFVIKQ